MKKFVIGLIVVLLFVVLFVTTRNSDHEKIHEWAKENNFVFVEVEGRFGLGPFWFKGKTDRIYEATTEDGRHYWFRIGLVITVEEYPKNF